MDKEENGQSDPEARQCKNYTQSELGRMLGVTNKAVSPVGEWRKVFRISAIGVPVSSVELPIQDICDRRAGRETGRRL